MPPRLGSSALSRSSASARSLGFWTDDILELFDTSSSTQCLRCRSRPAFLAQRTQQQQQSQPSQRRHLSTSPTLATRLRRDFWRWMNGPGRAFKNPLPNSTNYINAYDRGGGLIREGGKRLWLVNEREQEGQSRQGGAKSLENPKAIATESTEDLMPFPMNRYFRSQPVLSEELSEEIFHRIRDKKQDVRTVSALLGVEMRRVAAVVRLKTIEKQWARDGKPLAIPYAKAVKGMLPTTPYLPDESNRHESINDLPVHRATTRQIFHPTSESKRFTRRDAGEVFERGLLPADDRIPHPQQVLSHKLYEEGLHGDQVGQALRQRDEEEWRQWDAKEQRRRAHDAKTVKKVNTSRWEFRIRDVAIDEVVGKDGRSKNAIGQKYGVPPQDRKKGQVKIPTKVE